MGLWPLAATIVALVPVAASLRRHRSNGTERIVEYIHKVLPFKVASYYSLAHDIRSFNTSTFRKRSCSSAHNFLQARTAAKQPLSLLATERSSSGDGVQRQRRESAGHERQRLGDLGHRRQCNFTTDRTETLAPLVLPKYKLAFCYVPKAGCTQFKDLFNYLNGFSDNTLGFGHDYVRSMVYSFDNISLNETTKENGWKFATFTRDPALRYLSAFGSSCIADRHGHFEHIEACCGPATNNTVPQSELAGLFQARITTDLWHGLVDADDHWVQQVEILMHCGWDKFKPDSVDYWGMLSGDVNQQVKDMLAIVGLRNDSAVDRFFPKDSVAGHTNPMPGKPMDYINDLETLLRIMKLYEDDYRLLPGVGCSFTEPLLAELHPQKREG